MQFALPDLDDDTLHELLDTINESLDDIEIDLETLSSNPGDDDTINDIFRHLHSIKGNFRVCFLGPFSNFTHAIEETYAEIRSARLLFSPAIKEITLLSIDKLRSYMELLNRNHEIDTQEMEKIGHHFLTVATADADGADEAAHQLLGVITGSELSTVPIDADISEPEPESEVVPNSVHLSENDDTTQKDIRYFQELSLLLEARSPFWLGRTQRNMGVVTAVLPYLPYQIDRMQLHAALYAHDIGMAFLPDDLLNSADRLTDQQRQILHQHPAIAAEFLLRLGSWEPAAQMIKQHHERIDGLGYPLGLAGDDICEGAKLLAVTDAFVSLTTERADRNRRRTVLRALMEITTHSGTQFDEATVVAFTQMARDRYKN